MAAAPWYLLAVGIFILIAGVFLSVLFGPSDASRRAIDPAMRDRDIARLLEKGGGNPLPKYVILAGAACILVSIVWRLARIVV